MHTLELDYAPTCTEVCGFHNTLVVYMCDIKLSFAMGPV